MGYKELVAKVAASSLGSKVVATFFAPIDPILYKLSRGRLTSAGPQVLPQLVLTTTGRKSGKLRSVQLAYTVIDDMPIVVASNFGREHHPAWSYNLDTTPVCSVNRDGDIYAARAVRLSTEERDTIWEALCDHIEAYRVYVNRTDRKIRVYRLERRT